MEKLILYTHGNLFCMTHSSHIIMSCYFSIWFKDNSSMLIKCSWKKRHSDRASIIWGNLNEDTHWFTLDIHTLLTSRGQILHLYCVENTKTFTWIAQFNINSKTYCTSACLFVLPRKQFTLNEIWPCSGPDLVQICSKVSGSLGHYHPIAPCLFVVILTTTCVNYPVANMWNHVNIDRGLNQRGPLYTGVFQGNTLCGSDESKKTQAPWARGQESASLSLDRATCERMQKLPVWDHLPRMLLKSTVFLLRPFIFCKSTQRDKRPCARPAHGEMVDGCSEAALPSVGLKTIPWMRFQMGWWTW